MQVGLGRTEKRVLRRWRKRSAENTDRQVTEEENKDGFWAQVCGGMGAGLRVELEPAEFSQAKYRVFERYQKQVHNDEDCSPHGFRRFLCTSPLVSEGHLLGSFHQCHYMDDELIAVGVVDVLPLCVSAVYFFYDPSWAWLSPGTYGALREMALVHELHRHIDSLRYYYMGYYVPGCAKMEYKARWRPAELLDPLSFRWMPLEHCLACIARHPVFSSFDWAVQEDAVVRDAYDDVKREAAPALYEPLAQMEWSDVAPLKVWLDLNRFGQGYVDLSVGDLRGISVRIEQAVLQVVAAMGISLARRIKIIIV
ncbi:Arginyl-tRNA--protein transferase 1 [Coemansia sp. Benny D115]|nr:Arginyl-tRNA--protein transferase 1 [Coemansia sp. Benny D115]